MANNDCPASMKVFAVFELCEFILQGLSPKQILRISRVCKEIKSTIDYSIVLQRRLFLKPPIDSTATRWAIKKSSCGIRLDFT